MSTCRRGVAALVLVAVASLAACSDPEGPAQPSPTQTTPGASSPAAPSAPPSAAAPGAPSATSSPAPQSTTSATTSDQPVPKAGRDGQTAEPSISAKPAPVDKPVRYSDGVALRIRSIDFAKETKTGPGSFPGRQYAVLTLEVDNSSGRALSMASVVITVLDRQGRPVPPVYTSEAKVQDFSGTLKAGRTTRARYAFAVPRSSRSKVTVVVDFDGTHTSAVFRGKLG